MKRKNYRMLNPKPNVPPHLTVLIETQPSTPNARRVTLDSPVTYSPGFFSTLKSFQPFHPTTPTLSEDGSKAEVWQLSIWDPSTFSLNTFWYSPTHH